MTGNLAYVGIGVLMRSQCHHPRTICQTDESAVLRRKWFDLRRLRLPKIGGAGVCHL